MKQPMFSFILTQGGEGDRRLQRTDLDEKHQEMEMFRTAPMMNEGSTSNWDRKSHSALIKKLLRI